MSKRGVTNARWKRERTHPFSAGALHGPVSRIMQTEVTCVRERMRMGELLTFFREQGLHDAPVEGEDSVVVGVVSLGDLVHGGWGVHLQQSARTVADIMTRPVICLEPSARLTMAAALMAFEGVGRLPIVDAEKRIVGILSALDVLRWVGRQDGYSIPDYTQRARRRAWAQPC